MGALSITGKSMGSTSLNLTAGGISKTIPVTVKSRSLLAYGPASGNGLTATINADGSLNAQGENIHLYSGVAWTFDQPGIAGKQITFAVPDNNFGGAALQIILLDKADNLLVSKTIWSGSKSVTIDAPAAVTRVRLTVVRTGGSDGPVHVSSLKPLLVYGDTAGEWMKPDDTSLRGGYEPANLYPRVTGLPRQLAGGHITVTEETPGTYRIKGSTTEAANSWVDLIVTGHLDAGTYTLEHSDWPLGPKSWVIGVQATLTPDDGGTNIEFFPDGYGAKTLPSGTFSANIFVNTTGDVDALITPRLYRLDWPTRPYLDKTNQPPSPTPYRVGLSHNRKDKSPKTPKTGYGFSGSFHIQ